MSGSFTLNMTRWCNKAKGTTVLVVQKIAMETFKRVIYRSPVDTGRFRANWGCQVGSPYTQTVEIFDKDGRGTVVLAENVVKGWNGQGVVYLCNNLSYGPALEYFSHSGQAPNGMIRVTAAEIQAWAQNASNVMATIGSLRAATGGSE